LDLNVGEESSPNNPPDGMIRIECSLIVAAEKSGLTRLKGSSISVKNFLIDDEKPFLKTAISAISESEGGLDLILYVETSKLSSGLSPPGP